MFIKSFNTLIGGPILNRSTSPTNQSQRFRLSCTAAYVLVVEWLSVGLVNRVRKVAGLTPRRGAIKSI